MDLEARRRFARSCFGCGADNPEGLRLDVRVQDGRAYAELDPREVFQGFPGILHGGILITALDEVMGWAIYARGTWAVTAKMEVRFRQDVPLHKPLLAVGEVTRDRGGRTFQVRGEVRGRDDGALVAEATGLFIRMTDERLVELAQIIRQREQTSAQERTES